VHPNNELRVSDPKCQQFPLLICCHDDIGIDTATIQSRLKRIDCPKDVDRCGRDVVNREHVFPTVI
jgi:hypothetical protein